MLIALETPKNLFTKNNILFCYHIPYKKGKIISNPPKHLQNMVPLPAEILHNFGDTLNNASYLHIYHITIQVLFERPQD